MPTINGDGGDNVLNDTIDDDTINAGDGNDTITITRGFDNVDGGTGRDRLIINYSGATQGIYSTAVTGNLVNGYSYRIWQGNSLYVVDFTGIEDFTFIGGGSSDGITLGDGDDIASLGDGDDFVDFGAGNNSGDGGTGIDGFSANMGSATSAVNINLIAGNATFSNFEFFGTLTTGSGSDTIVTRGDVTRDETINSGGGNDTITVMRGFDTVNGGAGRDRLIIDYSGATQGVYNTGITGDFANGYAYRIWQGNSLFTVDFTGIEDFTFVGGGSNDSVQVGDGDDVINLGDGDDFADFGAGNDSGDGGNGTDGFSANLGSATNAIGINLVTGVSATFSNFEYLGTLTTGSGNDIIVTRGDVTANETINTGAGNDTVTVARGTDSVNGGDGRDRLIIDYSGATQGVNTTGITGSLASGYAFRIWQGNSLYTVDFTGIEDFTYIGGGNSDVILVGDGDDVINLGGGDDFADFGAGNDSGDGGTGIDGFSANLGSATTAISINLVTGASATFSNFEYLGTLTTGSGDDVIVTRGDVAGNEVINTGGGADTVTVARGADIVNGGTGRDRLIIDYSGATQGVYNTGITGDFANGYAYRIWQGNSNYVVDFTGIEDFTFVGGGSDDGLNFGDGDDIISGRGGNDFLYGGGGSDLIDGGDGNDTLDGQGGIDTVTYATAAAGVVVNLATTTAQNTVSAGIDTLAGFENLIGSGFGDTLTGSAGDNSIYGGDGNDLIIGNGGADTLMGEGGDDILRVNAAGAGSTLIGGDGIDTLEVDGNVTFTGSVTGVEAINLLPGANLSLTDAQFNSFFAPNSSLNGTGSLTINMTGTDFEFYMLQFANLGAPAATVIVNGSANDDVIKGMLNYGNTINGGDGHDLVRGGTQVDILNGGDGDDKIIGGMEADILTGGAGSDIFRFASAAQSGLGAAADQITDFVAGQDRIALAQIDADALTPGDQAISFIGNNTFAATGIGQVRYMDSGGDLMVQVDTDGNGSADMEIVLQGLVGQTLTGGDFIL